MIILSMPIFQYLSIESNGKRISIKNSLIGCFLAYAGPFWKKIFGKYTSRFSLSDSIIKNMCIDMLDSEKKIINWLI